MCHHAELNTVNHVLFSKTVFKQNTVVLLSESLSVECGSRDKLYAVQLCGYT